MNEDDFAVLVLNAGKTLGHDHPYVLLADAALHYNSTQAHRARARSAALDLLNPLLDGAPK
jgi:hypothetical protein